MSVSSYPVLKYIFDPSSSLSSPIPPICAGHLDKEATKVGVNDNAIQGCFECRQVGKTHGQILEQLTSASLGLLE